MTSIGINANYGSPAIDYSGAGQQAGPNGLNDPFINQLLTLMEEILTGLGGDSGLPSSGSAPQTSSPSFPSLPSFSPTSLQAGAGAGGPQAAGGGSGVSGLSGATGVSAVGNAGGPSHVDLSGFGDLQLPTGSAGHVDTVGAHSLGGYDSDYFKHNANGSITFSVPEGGGAHTAHSNFPRSELEEKGSWKMSSGTSTLSGTLSVDQLPQSGDVVIGQIHQKAVDGGKPRPPVELHFDKGKIVASVMDSNSPNAGRHDVVIATGVKPGQKFSYSMQLGPNGNLNISAAGQSKSVKLDSSFGGSNLYFKAGNYCQDPSGGSAVTFYGLGISHKAA